LIVAAFQTATHNLFIPRALPWAIAVIGLRPEIANKRCFISPKGWSCNSPGQRPGYE